MKILGIDPGKDGFLCLIDKPAGRLVVLMTEPTPTLQVKKRSSRRGYHVQEMVKIIQRAAPGFVVIEKQQAMAKGDAAGRRIPQGAASSFSTGRGYGLWEGIVAGLEIPYLTVHPRTWQKVCHRDITGDNPKAKSIIAAGRIFTGVDLRKTTGCSVPHDGKADALMLAYYGHLHQGGKI